MAVHVLDLREIDQGQAATAGGKGASLGEFSRIAGIRVPAGFCITTDAFRQIIGRAQVGDRLARLSRLDADDGRSIRALAAEIRAAIERTAAPEAVAAAIVRAVGWLGEQRACAVRSSAAAEDSPSASFAGLHDTYLNVIGPAAILEGVSRCWASLYTDRAVAYRLQKGFDHRDAAMAVVVQRMVPARAAGTLFTADPVTGNRRVASVEAGFGLGEALVSGRVNVDVYRVRAGEVVARTLAPKEPATRDQAVLSDAQVVRLDELGRRIEAHFGRPQDIEWCLGGDGFEIVQSRPITTLFPIPEAGDEGNRVFVSVGHQQMMTDAIRPLGISIWKLTALRSMYDAGGRLFVEVSRELASPSGRAALVEGFGRSDPLTGDALRILVERGDFVAPLADGEPGERPARGAPPPIDTDPSLVSALIARTDDSLAALRRDIRTRSGTALLDFILADLEELKRLLADPLSSQAIRAGMEAAWWLNAHLEEWLGERSAADALTRSVPNNITSEMGLALLEVADVVRRHPDVAAFLEQSEGEDRFLEGLPQLAGGLEVRDAIGRYLDRYGMRCAGEIDITRPRWAEHPATLVPLILSNLRTSEPGAAERQFRQGQQEARAKEQELLARLRDLPGGDQKAESTRRMIERLRTFSGYREYPKYGMVSRYFAYRQALLQEAARLVRAGVLDEEEDIFYLTFEELRDVVRRNQADGRLIRERRESYRLHQALSPPRVLTSEGEVITGSYRRSGLRAGALVGLAVSAGIVEGRARVIHDLARAELEAGDILVTTYTDPSWSPLFAASSGLVTEVGGLTTHGAVIAREYGLPSVVGVENATRLIRDGRRIRVNGSEGYVELLGADP